MKLFLLLFSSLSAFAGSGKFQYQIDLRESIQTDSFHVTLTVEGVTGDSTIYQFAATAPGTYQVMDVGRLVGSFSAADRSGHVLPSYRLSTNQFVIRDARSLAKVQYRISDSFDENLAPHPIYLMCGSNLEQSNAQINPHMVIGYFHGHQSDPIRLRLDTPQDWVTGTALPMKDGDYVAETFDHLVDSPLLSGKLDHSGFKVSGTQIDIYSYSETGSLKPGMFEEDLKKLLTAADRFLGGLPVKQYTFLFHLRTNAEEMGITGAWEHSYSSGYVVSESIPKSELLSTIAHEFFHIVTPLNIHSEIIEKFNFVKPVASQHLWLYEGTTEWASDMMQVRGGLISDTMLLRAITIKMNNADAYDPNVSLVDLSLGSYDQHVGQYGNIYMRGALTAMMLDMRILELSKGKKGLRDVMKKLSRKYGPKKAFPENGFFEVFVKETYPEIADFFERHVKKAEPLPVKEYLAKAGYEYFPNFATGQFRPNAGKFIPGFDGQNVVVTSVVESDSVTQELGIQTGDKLIRFAAKDKDVGIFQGVQGLLAQLQVGDEFSWTVLRGDQELKLTARTRLTEIVVRHKILHGKEATREQNEFRTAWLTNR